MSIFVKKQKKQIVNSYADIANFVWSWKTRVALIYWYFELTLFKLINHYSMYKDLKQNF